MTPDKRPSITDLCGRFNKFFCQRGIEGLVLRYGSIYRNDVARVENNRNEWVDFSKQAKAFFYIVIEEYNKRPFFSMLYQDDNNAPFERKINQNVVCLRFGIHQTGITETKYDPTNETTSGRRELERGGALVYSQCPNGEVLCFIYGCKSEVLKPKDEYFIFKRYKRPIYINENELRKALKAFFWYTRVTSFRTNFSLLNTVKLDFYKVKAFTYKPDWNAIFGVIGAIAALGQIIAWIAQR